MICQFTGLFVFVRVFTPFHLVLYIVPFQFSTSFGVSGSRGLCPGNGSPT